MTEPRTLRCDDWFDDNPPDSIGTMYPEAVPIINGMDRLFKGEFEDKNDPALFEIILPADPQKELGAIVLDLANAVYHPRHAQVGTRFNLLAITGIVTTNPR